MKCGKPEDLPVILVGQEAWDFNHAKPYEIHRHIHIHLWPNRECSLIEWRR